MNKEMKYHNLYQSIARECAKMSHAKKLQVGAILVKDGRILSTGWNGMPSGWDNNCEDSVTEMTGWCSAHRDGENPNCTICYPLKTKPEVLHAEQNAILKLTQSTDSSSGATIYITHQPCISCAKLIYGAGIIEVIYENGYDSENTRQGKKFLDICKIKSYNIKV